jgi:hypothetical protein
MTIVEPTACSLIVFVGEGNKVILVIPVMCYGAINEELVGSPSVIVAKSYTMPQTKDVGWELR